MTTGGIFRMKKGKRYAGALQKVIELNFMMHQKH